MPRLDEGFGIYWYIIVINVKGHSLYVNGKLKCPTFREIKMSYFQGN